MKWTKEYIMEQLQEHWNEALQDFPRDRVVGIFCQGSQNYGLSHDGSDLDTKLIVVPAFEDICFNKKPVSTTHVRENDEHIDYKDIRLMFQTFRKQNLNFLEILFTEYKIINPLYKKQWDIIEANAEKIARYDWKRCCKTMKGIALEKFHALEHRYPSRMEWLDKFGYDPKQLSHLLRIEEFLKRYIAGENFKECLQTKQSDYLIAVKKGMYTLDEARLVASTALEEIKNLTKDFTKEADENSDVDKILDEVQYKIMKKAIEMELNKYED